ncbi:hypothetical protein D3C78_1021720 [compost metagenome]
MVETVYTEAQPTDLTQQVSRLLRKGATVLQVFNNTASVVATRRALQSLGKPHVPIVMTAHNGLISSGKAMGGLEQMDGNYEVYGMAMPVEDMTATRAFYDKLRAQYKVQSSYNSACIMGMSQALIVARAVEQAVKTKGAKNLKGEDVREALLSTPMSSERSFGVLPDLRYSKEAPFPTDGVAVNIGTVEKGKYRLVEQNVSVPALNKW